MHLVELDGHDWDTYTKLFNSDKFLIPPFLHDFVPPNPRSIPAEHGINPDLLFTGNISHGRSARRLVSQFIQTCALSGWVQHYGRVRFLLWMVDPDKERILPRVVQSRTRPSIVADTTCKVTEVVGSGTVRTGKGFQTVKKSPKSTKPVQLTRDISQRKKIQKIVDKAEAWKELITEDSHRYSETNRIKKVEMWKNRASVAMGEYLACRNAEVWLKSDGPYLGLGFESLKALWDESGNPSSPPKDVEGEEEFDTAQVLSFNEFEEDYLVSTTFERGIENSLQDEIYAHGLDPPLLQSWRDYNAAPIIVDAKNDIFPANPLALLDFQPLLVHEYFRNPDPSVRTQRWKTYDWVVRTLFLLRAQTLRMSLKSLAPGAESILEDLPDGNGKALGAKRVRLLTVNELVEITKVWDAWPFKPEDIEWSGFRSQMDELVRSG
jgi:hypothetical protein